VGSARSRTDWWTWGDHPTTTDSDKQLALDPACGGGESRPLVTDMLALAAKRRAGQHPAYTTTWGAAIAGLPDLKTLELILETFSAKKHQLDNVVECAKTWKFPLKDTHLELVCDGNVESTKWAKAADQDVRSESTDDEDDSEAHYSHQAADFDEQSGSPYSPVASTPPKSAYTNQEGASTGSPQSEPGPTNGAPSRRDDDSEPIGLDPVSPQQSPISSEDSQYPRSSDRWYNSPSSPHSSPSYFSPTSPHYSPQSEQEMVTFPEVSWLRDANEFDVSIVRFRRRKVD
jgi:hypothetical protein